MRESILKYSLYVAGAICFSIFLLVRLDHLPPSLVVDLDQYGDLYRLNYVNKFKYILPEKKLAFNESDKHADLNDAEILIFGDSFFNYRRHKSVPEQIADELNKKVFFIQSHFVDLFLSHNNYNSAKRRILIFEIAERGIPIQFGETNSATNQFQFKFFEKLDTTVFAQKYNDRYRFLLERSKLTYPIYSALNSFNFNQFGAISNSTPKYNTESGWLFYESTVNNKPGSYNYKYSNIEIENYADKMFEWKENISKKYNVEILFFIIPNKSSVYHSKIGREGYSNFLPQLGKALDSKGVNYINLYIEFSNTSDILYYPTDTHWNEKGEKIGAERLIEYLKNLN